MACHGNSINNTKAIQTKNFFETLRCICIHCQHFISIVAVQEFGGGGVTKPPLVSRCRSKTPSAGKVKTLTASARHLPNKKIKKNGGILPGSQI